MYSMFRQCGNKWQNAGCNLSNTNPATVWLIHPFSREPPMVSQDQHLDTLMRSYPAAHLTDRFLQPTFIGLQEGRFRCWEGKGDDKDDKLPVQYLCSSSVVVYPPQRLFNISSEQHPWSFYFPFCIVSRISKEKRNFFISPRIKRHYNSCRRKFIFGFMTVSLAWQHLCHVVQQGSVDAGSQLFWQSMFSTLVRF